MPVRCSKVGCAQIPQADGNSLLFDPTCVVQLGEGYTPCHGVVGLPRRPELTRAHMAAWKKVADSGESAAWIFE